jgi:general secretion pathway protein J
MALPARNPRQRHARGFTLIELLVAVSIMALMTVMGWRALDGMVQAAGQTRTHTDAVLTLEAGLAQWVADLDALIELPHTTAIDWDGRALRVTRRHSADPSEGVLVVAWSRGAREGADPWLRWQSAPVRSRADWQNAWDNAAQWAQSPSDLARQQEVAIAPLTQWQVYFFRGGAWSNPLSSAGSAAAPDASLTTVPDGVRLVMETPAPHPLAGRITRDWARPTLAGSTP